MPGRTIAIALLAVALCGCAPNLVASNEAGGVVDHAAPDTMGTALKLADDHCKQFGKTARISDQSAIDSTVTFDCVKL